MKKSSQAKEPTIRTLRVADLVKLPEHQMRRDRKGNVRIDDGKVREYAIAYAAGRELPPVRIAVVDGLPHLVDGWHRVAALERNQTSEVEAEVHLDCTLQDALAMAALANLEHGLPLKSLELRHAFNALIKARRHIPKRGRLCSYRDLAEMLGNRVRHTTVRNWMQKDHPKIAREMGRGEPEPSWDAEPPSPNRQEALETLTMQALREARATARGITAPARRGRVLAMVRATEAEIEAGGKWELPDETPDF